MAKYNFEFKKKIVDEYLNGQGGYCALAEKYSIAHSIIEKWVNAYKSLGEDGLKRSRAYTKYPLEYKWPWYSYI